MSKELTPEVLWQPAFDEVWNKISPFILGKEARKGGPECEYGEVFMSGGRGGGKSYTIAEWIWLALTNDHRKNAVVLRKFGSSIRKSCFKQMLKALKKLRLEQFWTVNKTDLTMTNNYTKQQVVFLGLDDEDKVRSITTDVGYFSIVWFEEARQFTSIEEIRQTKASILRGGADDLDEDEVDDSDAEFMTFLSYNPPKSAHEWINKEAKKHVQGRLVHHSTYLTMPPKWLGKGFIREAEALRESDPDAYAHQYLGKVTGTGGEYFHNVEVRKITQEEIDSFDYFNMGIDWGMNDPNVFLKTYIDEDHGIMYIFDGVYQKDWDTSSEKTKYQQFAEEVLKHLNGCIDDPIWSDAQGKAEGSILSSPPYNMEIQFAPKQGANGRDEGYRYFQSLKKIVIDESLPEVAEEFQLFEAKELPNGEGWMDKPGTKGDHSPDCARYSEWEAIKDASFSLDD